MPNLQKIIENAGKELERLNQYPSYLEKSHLTDGSEECFWAERNNKIKSFLSAKISEAVKGVLEEIKLNKQTECENKSEAEAIYYEQGYNTAVQNLEAKIAEILN